MIKVDFGVDVKSSTEHAPFGAKQGNALKPVEFL